MKTTFRLVLGGVAVILACLLVMPAMAAEKAKKSDDAKININTATVEELRDGLVWWRGEEFAQKGAEAIVDFRTKHGPFKFPLQIVQVPILDTQVYEENKDRIKLSD